MGKVGSPARTGTTGTAAAGPTSPLAAAAAPPPPEPASNPVAPTHATASTSEPIRTLDETAVLANRFIPSSLKALNQAPTSCALVAGRIPTLAAQIERLYEDLIPRGIECACEPSAESMGSSTDGTRKKKRLHSYEGGRKVTMDVRRIQGELRYALFSNEALSHVLERKGDSSSSPTDDPNNNTAKQMERQTYAEIIGSKRIKTAIGTRTRDLENVSSYRDKYEGLLLLERDEILRLHEHLSQYRVQVSPFSGNDSGSAGPTASTFLYAHIVMPGIADVQPALSVGDICLVRPVEPLQLPAHQQGSEMVYDQSRRVYVPNPVEIQCLVLRIIRGRAGNPDEVVITWLSAEVDSALQHAWSFYPPSHRLYNVRFIPSTQALERCLTALDWASRLPNSVADGLILAREEEVQLALPKYKDGHKHSEAEDGKYIDLGQYSLNEKQHDFVSMCLSRTIHPSMERVREPMLLTGPAGVGKTRTLFAAINQILDLNPKNRILVCAPSHTAANVLTQRLGENLSKEELFRLVDSNRGSDTIPFAVLRFTHRDQSGGTFALPPTEQLLKFRVIVCTCLDAHILYSAGLTNATLRTWRRCLRNSVQSLMQKCRLSFVGDIRGVDEPHFTHLFIDEAAQATEPETLIPLSVAVDPEPGSVKVEIALVGDPRQLGAQVYSRVAAERGLGFSLLERLLQRPNALAIAEAEEKHGDNPIDNMGDLLAYYNEDKDQTSVFLNVNYRCRPEFLMMPSCLFYFDKLQSAKSKTSKMISDPEVTSRWCRELRMLEKMRPRVEMDEEEAGDVPASIPRIYRPYKQEMWPIHFRGVTGRDVSVALDSFPGTNSWSNLDEAKEVSEIVVALTLDGVKPEKIGVMSPFRGQVVQIRRLLREAGLGQVNVGTIEDYQAVEFDAIVLSLTRSTPKFVEFDIKRRAGVFGQPKRSNVALTRPEHLLVIVGNPNVMASCPIWRQILWFCLRNGLWYGEQGSIGCAGLKLTNELVYSNTGTGDIVDESIVTVGTLEKISRRTEAFDKDSIESIVAMGIFTISGENEKSEMEKEEAPCRNSGTAGPTTAGQPTAPPGTVGTSAPQVRGNMQQPMPYPYSYPGPPGPMGQGMPQPPPYPGMMHLGIPPGMMGRGGGPMPTPPPGHPAFGQMLPRLNPYPFGPGAVGPPPPGMMMGPPPAMMGRGGGPMPPLPPPLPGHGPPPPGYMQHPNPYGQGPTPNQPTPTPTSGTRSSSSSQSAQNSKERAG